jgi:hypothetical protein
LQSSVSGPARLRFSFGGIRMRSQRLWLFALLGSVAIEAFLSTMIHRAIVVPGGRTFWATVGEMAHIPGNAVAEAFLDMKNPFGFLLGYASGFVIWFLVFWGAIAAVVALLGYRRAEPDASPNGGPAQRFGNSAARGGPPSVS